VTALVHVRHSSSRTVVVDARSAYLPRGHRLRSAVVDFGDHHSAHLRTLSSSVQHHYAKPGAYVTRLTVVDSTGQRDVSSAAVVVGARASAAAAPTAVLSFDDDSNSAVTVTDDSTLADASGSTAPDGGNLGTATLDYGDGTVVGFSGDPSQWQDDHSYGSAGTYTATLTVVSANGGVGTTTSTVTALDPPSVAIAGPLGPVAAGTPVTFGVLASTPAGLDWADYAIDYGNGSDAESVDGAPPASFTETFDSPGVYVVGIAVQDSAFGTASSAYLVTVV
jgi:PKD repeat protein